MRSSAYECNSFQSSNFVQLLHFKEVKNRLKNLKPELKAYPLILN